MEAVEDAIKAVEKLIEQAGQEFLSALGNGKQYLADYWREEKQQLREKEKQLREEKQQLREKELKLLGTQEESAIDFVHKVCIPLIRGASHLPDLDELGSYLQHPLRGDRRFPVQAKVYGALSHEPAAGDVFRPRTPQDGSLMSDWFAMGILQPPCPDGSEDSFHVLWDTLVFLPLRTFLGHYGLRNKRNETGESTLRTLRCDVTYYLDGYALCKGEEKGLQTDGDPAQELIQKDSWPYLESLPYVLAYWTRGHTVQLCALYRQRGSAKFGSTQLLGLVSFDMRSLDDRIRLLLACFHMAKLLRVLKDVCAREGVEPDSVFERRNGKVVEVYGNTVKKSFRDREQTLAVIQKYIASAGSKYVESMMHGNEEKTYVITNRGFHRKPRSGSELRQCIRCVLEALVHLHSKGIMHRDIRWDNVVKGMEEEQWFVIDLDEATGFPCPEGHTSLDPRSHAPEICGPHDLKVDIWGVGHLIRGCPMPVADPVLERIMRICLAGRPEDRPTAEECLAFLSSG